MSEEKTCPQDNGICHYTKPKRTISDVMNLIVAPLLVLGISALIVTVIRVDRKLGESYLLSTTRQHSVDGSISEIKDDIRDIRVTAAETKDSLLDLKASFRAFESRVSSSFYTVSQATEDQRRQADELQSIWEALHSVQKDVVRLQTEGKTAYIQNPR